MWLRWWLRTIQAWDRLRLRLLAIRHPGLEIDPAASSNFASARFSIAPGARLRIGAGCVTERRRGGVNFVLYPGARLEIGPDTWLRCEIAPVNLVVFDDARLTVGPRGFLNGCHLSAKGSLTLGEHVWVGMGSRVFDSDQHDLDDDRPERIEPVTIEDFVWVASDSTVLRGVRIGEHSVVGTRSLVTRDVPPHTLAFGCPAVPRGSVGDRSHVH